MAGLPAVRPVRAALNPADLVKYLPVGDRGREGGGEADEGKVGGRGSGGWKEGGGHKDEGKEGQRRRNGHRERKRERESRKREGLRHGKVKIFLRRHCLAREITGAERAAHVNISPPSDGLTFH